MVRRLIGVFFSLVGIAVIALLVTLRVRYGGGNDFPNRSGAPQLRGTVLEQVAELPTPPGNVAVSATGRIFATLHPEAHPQMKVVEIVAGAPQPWPNAEFQSGAGEPRHFRDPLSLRIDAQNRLWTLDPGHHGTDHPRLLAFDLKSGQVVHEFEFPKALAGRGSHLNDFQVSPDGAFIYIADASFFAKTPALLVYDVAKQAARRVLQGHPSVTAQYFTPVVRNRRMVAYGLVSIRPGVDSITLDDKGEWLYFAPVTNLSLYRVRTADLRDENLSAADLAGKVETYADKTMSDGITIDSAGNVYISDPEHDAIQLLRTDKTLQTLVADDKLRWPDGFSWGPDGWLYVSCSSLHSVIGLPPWTVKEHAPYQIWRFKPGGKGTPGH